MATPLSNPSIIDFLKSEGQDSSFSARKKLAQEKGITNFRGTAAQNTQLLGLLRQETGQAPQDISSRIQGLLDPQAGQSVVPTDNQTFVPPPTGRETPQQEEARLLGVAAQREQQRQQGVINDYNALLNRGASQQELQNFFSGLKFADQNLIIEQQKTQAQGAIAESTFASEALADPLNQEWFNSLPPDVQRYVDAASKYLESQAEQGNTVNPNIDFTHEETQRFLERATKELDPFFQETMKGIRQDLDISFSRLTEDLEREITQAEEPFTRGLAEQAEAEAGAGLAFGSERKKREERAIQQQQRGIESALRETTREGQRLARQGERELGSEAFGQVSVPGIRETTVGRGGFQRGAQRRLFTPQGGLIGSEPRKQATNIEIEKRRLEEETRRERGRKLTNI
jgi:hypothetical protein